MNNYIDSVVVCMDGLLPILSNPGNERNMYDYVRDLFMNLGFVDIGLGLIREKYQIHKMVIRSNDETWYKRNVPNLGMSFAGSKTKPHLLLNAHLDHYFASSITKQKCVDGNWMLGDAKNILGADCKAGIALIYAFVKKAMEEKDPPSIDLVFDTCEEAGLVGIMEFQEEKQYHAMPFWQRYVAGHPVFSYCFDGLYNMNIGDMPRVYVNRSAAEFLSGYFMCQSGEKICDIVGDAIKWRRLTKKERLLVASMRALRVCDAASVIVEKYGSALIILNKIIPTLMFPMGFIDCHSDKE